MSKEESTPEIFSKVKVRKIGKSVDHMGQDFKDLNDAAKFIENKRQEIFSESAVNATNLLKDAVQTYHSNLSSEEQSILTIQIISTITKLDKNSFDSLLNNLGLIENDNEDEHEHNSENGNEDEDIDEYRHDDNDQY